jgi:uroporphyrinogen decarboxylase
VTHRENFLRAIEGRRPDWVPIVFDLLPAVWTRHGEKLTELVLRHPQAFWNLREEQLNVPTRDPLYVEGSRVRDDWGCLWHNAHGGVLGQVVEHPLSDWSALPALRVPDPLTQIAWADLERDARGAAARGLPVIAFPESFAHGGFFDRLQFLRGLENLLVDLLNEPPALAALMDRVLDYNLRYIDRWLAAGDIDVIWFHGDIGTQNGPLLGPELFRRHLKPAYREMFQRCRRAGVHVWYSSDGNILPFVDDLAECGVSIHDPQVRACTVDGIARAYNGKLCALVDIDEQMLHSCSPRDIFAQVKEVRDKVGSRDGGLMIYAIPNRDVPLANIEALAEAWESCCT